MQRDVGLPQIGTDPLEGGDHLLLLALRLILVRNGVITFIGQGDVTRVEEGQADGGECAYRGAPT